MMIRESERERVRENAKWSAVRVKRRDREGEGEDGKWYVCWESFHSVIRK